VRKVTITGWTRGHGKVEKESYWPEEMDVYLCVSRATKEEVNLMTIENVEVEEDGDGE